MIFRQTITFQLFLFITLFTNAQDIEFGKISNEELLEDINPIDSSAVAAYLYKNRKSYYTYSSNAGLASVSYTHLTLPTILRVYISMFALSVRQQQTNKTYISP